MTNETSLPAWAPRKDSDDRKASAIEAARALLEIRESLVKAHLKELLSITVWKHTECDGKYTTRFQSTGAIQDPKGKLNHEHVIPRKNLVEAMLAEPHRVAEIMETAIGCTVSKSEHDRIMVAEKANPALQGWDRYRAAGVEVYDLATGNRLI